MKQIVALVISGLVCASACMADAPKTKEDFLAAVKAVFASKDAKKLEAMTYENGMSDFDHQQITQMLPMIFGDMDGTETYSLAALAQGDLPPAVMMGRRVEMTHAADGTLKIVHKSADGSSTSTMTLPYAVIDGGYYIVTMKSTDLGWKGPADKQLVLNVEGNGQDKVKVHVKYNASGVDLEEDAKYPSLMVVGQFFSEVTVKSDSDDVDVVLDLRDQPPGQFHYRSAPLKGKGEIHFHKGDKSAPEQ